MPIAWNSAYALARLAHRQDREAWAYVAQTCSKGIYTLTWRILRDRALAEDALQETLLQVRRHAGRFRPPENNPEAAARSWIMHIAYNVALKMARKRARRWPLWFRAQPERTEPKVGELAEAVHCAVLRLPEAYRSPIVLRYYAGLPYEEVARRLGLQPAAVRKRVERGLGLLRERISDAKQANNAVGAGCLMALPAGFACPEPFLPAASALPALLGVVPSRFATHSLRTWAGVAATIAVVLCVAGMARHRGPPSDETAAAVLPKPAAKAKAEQAPAPLPAPVVQPLPAPQPRPEPPPAAEPKPAAKVTLAHAPDMEPQEILEVEIAPRVIYRKRADDLDVTEATAEANAKVGAQSEAPDPEPWKQAGPRIAGPQGMGDFRQLIAGAAGVNAVPGQAKAAAFVQINGKELIPEEIRKAAQGKAGNPGGLPATTVTINNNGDVQTITIDEHGNMMVKQGQ